MSAAAAHVRPPAAPENLLLLLIERAQREIEDEAGRMGGHDDRARRASERSRRPPVGVRSAVGPAGTREVGSTTTTSHTTHPVALGDMSHPRGGRYGLS